MKGRLPLEILYEDADVIVIDKPAGLLATHTHLHGRAARESQATAENFLNDYVRKGQSKSRKRVWLVHRLDRETSGVMMFAKSEEMADAFRSNWSALTEKTYLARVEGSPTGDAGVFESWLREDADGYRVRSVRPKTPGAKPARTEWRRLSSSGGATLVEVKLRTGRKNQIRVHFSEAGHPVAGDVKYGARRAERLYLHSRELRFMNPRTGEWRTVAADPPEPKFGIIPEADGKRYGMKTHAILLAAAAALAALATGCRTVPVTGRSQLMLSSDASEREMGATAYSEYKSQTKPSRDSSQQALLARVGAAVSEAAGDTGFAWEFTVLQSDEVNAFCLPGGKVAVYTGIMPKFSSEAELACVVAHEVGHAIARHGGERMSWTRLQAVGTLGLSLAGCGDMVQQIYGIGTQYGILLPYSRSHESEADLIGLYLMAKAGYDPRAAVTFWKKFGSGASSKLGELASTHPCDATRVKNLSDHMPEALEIYGRCEKKRGLGVAMSGGRPSS